LGIHIVTEGTKMMDAPQKPLKEVFDKDGNPLVEPPERAINTVPLFPLRQILPAVVERLKHLLTEGGEAELAATVEGLQVYDRCPCGSDYCTTVYTKPRRSGGDGPSHRTVVFWNSDTIGLDTVVRAGYASKSPRAEFTTIIDVIDDGIARIEILDDHDSRRRLIAALPDEGTAE
jgi:hypothetical protein